MDKRFFLLKIIGLVIAILITMVLWNWLVPEIFGLATLSFWQAAGLLILSRILFGRFSFGGPMHERMRRNPFKEKWMKMTLEEREEFIKKRREYGPFSRNKFFGMKNYRNDEPNSTDD